MLEIEELSKMFDDDVDCDVRETGCLGYCRRGPAALITRDTKSSVRNFLLDFTLTSLQ